MGEKKKEAKKKRDLEKKKEEKQRIENQKLEMERLEKKKAAEEKEREERRKTDPREQVKIKFEAKCKEASNCMATLPKSAMDGYGEVLEMIAKDYPALRFTSK